jgi:hypothetical protein
MNKGPNKTQKDKNLVWNSVVVCIRIALVTQLVIVCISLGSIQ